MKKILIATLGVGLLLGSCTKDFEEINKNPNVPEDYLTYALFNGSNQALMNNTRGYDNMKQMRVWMQYSTSIRLSSTVPVGNFVVTVILGLLLTFTFDILSFLLLS